MSLIASGAAANRDIGSAFVLVCSIAPPPAGGDGRVVLLVVRLQGLDPAHQLAVRYRRGLASTIDEDQPGNGQAEEELEIEEVIAPGDSPIDVYVGDTAGASAAAGWFWQLHDVTPSVEPPAVVVSPDPGAPDASGYYAKESIMRLTAGDSFDQEFNLLAAGLVADPALVALAQSLADTFVDGEAWKLRIPFPAGAGGHAVETTDDPLYSSLCLWASRWARAQGHLIRGERGGGMGEDVEEVSGGEAGGGTDDIEGSLTRMRSEAERRIVQLLKVQRERQRLLDATRHTGIGVLSCLDGRPGPRGGSSSGIVGPFA